MVLLTRWRNWSNADIVNVNSLQSFEYKAKLLENTVADEANGILKNETIAATQSI